MNIKKCYYCGETDVNNFDIDERSNGENFFCNSCEAFNGENRNFYFLIKEKKSTTEDLVKTEKSKEKIKTFSLLRYPGGKSKMINYVFQNFIKEKNIKTFIEPYAGGASVGFSLLMSNKIEKLILNEKNYGLYCLWHSILNNHKKLIKMIEELIIDIDLFNLIKEHSINGYEYFENKEDKLTPGLYFLINNRLAFSGIFNAGPLGGKNGTQEKLLSRWNKEKIIFFINEINKNRDRIEISNEDALLFIEEKYWLGKETLMFIDPPYIEKGKQLYKHYYNEENHKELAFLLETLFFNCEGSHVVVTYDEHIMLDDIYNLSENIILNRKYSI